MSTVTPRVGPPEPGHPQPESPSTGTSPQGTGVHGASNFGAGVWGQSLGPWASNVAGTAADGVLGEGRNGVRGVSGSTLGHGGAGVRGENTSNGPGVYAISTSGDAILATGKNGVHGQSASPTDSGVWGENTGSGYGMSGSSTSGNGVIGLAGGAPPTGVQRNGVVGRTTSGSDSGVWGDNTGSGYGVSGSSASGVGVYGKGTPAGRFDGDVEVAGNLNMLSQGDVILNDLAEHFDATDGGAEPGTVMVVDHDGNLRPGDSAYDRRVAGVVSGAGNFKPGIILGNQQSSAKDSLIALLGKVYCKVDASSSPIEVGDMLTTSATPGHAMKATDPSRAFGAVIGKALRPLPSGCGMIPILIALQ